MLDPNLMRKLNLGSRSRDRSSAPVDLLIDTDWTCSAQASTDQSTDNECEPGSRDQPIYARSTDYRKAFQQISISEIDVPHA